MILRRFHYNHRHYLLPSLASLTTVKVHKNIFVHAVFIVACPQIPFNKSADTYAMHSEDEMLGSVVGGGCGASNPEDSSAIADDEGKQVAYLALEAKPKLVAADVQLENPLTGTSRSQIMRRKHAKGIAGSLMN